MANTNYFRKASFWVSVLAILGLSLLMLSGDGLLAAPTKRNVNFDHVKTGFPLSGAHATLPCETCHVQGAFKGTPKKCATCHTQGSRIQTTTFKPSNHIVTTQACDQCHTSTASWSVAFFSHAGVTPHQCSQCHNGNIAKGKPANHMPTTEACDACHRTTTWTSASFTHVAVTPGSCASCHSQGGAASTFKPSNHIPTTLSCDVCHTTGGSFGTSKFTHSATQGVMAGQCSTCHNGSFTQWNALGKSSNHVSTTASCDTCHAGFVSFAGMSGTTFNHAGVNPGTCATCHVQGGSAKTFKPTDHIPTTQSCDACHSTGGTFTTTSFAHTTAQGVAAGQCSTCHNGSFTKWNALAKPSNHIPTSLACDACHTAGGTFKPSTFTHAATQGVVPQQCATCHSGAYASMNALGKPSNHVATTMSCDSCHTGYVTFASVTGATFNHAGVSPGTCSSCHVQGGSATAKPSDHIPTNLSCDSCHTTGGSFTTSTFTHSAAQGIVAGQCTTCHNGSYAKWNALGKPSNHLPTTLSCNACHATGGSFTTSTFTHSSTQGVVTGQCATCHNGSYVQWNALGKTTNHVATTASCDTCHKNYTSFAGAAFSHTSVTPGTCATCHTQGGSGTAKPNNHIPTTLSCDACHNTTTFTTSTFTHATTQGVVAGQCTTCHNGSYTQWNALGKPTNHIPYEAQLLAGSSMNCDSCHKSKTSFTSQTMNHNNSQGNGSGWCKGCHASGTSFLGSMEKKSLTHQKSSGVTDCSQSGCHRPLGTRGSPYNSW